jgi:hypothetical protein
MKKIRLLTAVVALSLAGSLAAAASAPAGAAIGARVAVTAAKPSLKPWHHPSSPPPGFKLVARQPMIVTGFNRAIARAHGYMIIFRHGVEMSVPKGHPNAAPLDKVSGVCGDSYVYASAGSIGQFYFYTGWDIKTSLAGPSSYEWVEDITGPPPYDNVLRQGPAGYKKYSWRYPDEGSHLIPVDDGGTYYIEVETLSFVDLSDGTVCHSDGPTSSAEVG